VSDLSTADIGATTESIPEAVVHATEAPAPDDIPEVPADQPVFDRGYVVKIREEAAKYRTELRDLQAKHATYDEVFSGYEPDDVAVWLDLARTWAQDPSSAATMMRDIAQQVLAEGGTPEQAQAAAEAVQQVAEESQATDRPLTAEDVEKLVSERLQTAEAERAREAAIQGIRSEVRELGFEPDSMQGVMLMWIAHNQTGGDLAAAKGVIDTHNQSIIDGYLQTKQPGYKIANSPASTPGAGTIEPPKTLEEAGRRANAFYQAQRG
jgi:hypothetical protein